MKNVASEVVAARVIAVAAAVAEVVIAAGVMAIVVAVAVIVAVAIIVAVAAVAIVVVTHQSILPATSPKYRQPLQPNLLPLNSSQETEYSSQHQ